MTNDEEEKKLSYEERKTNLYKEVEFRQNELRENVVRTKENKLPDDISLTIKAIESRLHGDSQQ